jgi:hypothetical protein
MFDIERISEWRGQDVLDPEDHRVGRLEEIYYDRQSSSPGFACVKTGLFGRRLTFIPLTGASMARDHIRVAYPADQIKRAPNVEPDGQLTLDEEAALFEHYGLERPLEADSHSPRLVRYQTEAAAAQVAEARQLVADQGEVVASPADYAAGQPAGYAPAPPAGDAADAAGYAAAGSAATAEERRRYQPGVQVGEPGEVVADPAAYVASAGAAATPEERMRYDAPAPAAGGLDAERLRALEDRVAAIENWLSAHS